MPISCFCRPQARGEIMPPVLMASTELLALAPMEAPPAYAPQLAKPPSKTSSSQPPPTPTPSPPLPPPPPPPAKAVAPVSSNHNSRDASTGATAAEMQFMASMLQTQAPLVPMQSPPPATPPPPSPPPPSSPPRSPPLKSPSPPPPSWVPSSPSPPPPPPSPSSSSPPSPAPSTSTPPSQNSPPTSTSPLPSIPPPPSEQPLPNMVMALPPPDTASANKIPAEPGAPPSPEGTPAPVTPPTPPASPNQAPPGPAIPSSASQVLLPPVDVVAIMPGSPSPPGTSQSPPFIVTPGAPATPAAQPTGGYHVSPAGNVQQDVLIGVAVAGFLLALLSVFIFLCFRNRGKKRHVHWTAGPNKLTRKNTIVVPERSASPDVFHPSNAPSASPSGTNSYDFSGSKAWFTYEELVDITGGFSAENVIGEGGFGRVYMGALSGGRRVAVKQLKVGSGQGEKEFRAEVEIISRIHHRHLVTLVGYCVTEHHRLLVYEFVPNKTLERHLHGKGLPVMDWPKRLKIAIGSARGLTYLHEDCHPRIIHRDIKSANILLDDAFEAKVADFGLAKLTNDSLTHISTRVMGTFGYMAPEYASSGKLTDRSDVFSFGVVLLELITGRKPVDASQPLGEESLVEWARPLLVSALETDDFQEIADPALAGRFSQIEMRRMVEAAAACVRHSASKRPRMVQVWRSLDIEGSSPDLTNGVKLGQSTAYDSSQYSADIELFRRMAFAGDVSAAEFGFPEDDEDGSTEGYK